MSDGEKEEARVSDVQHVASSQLWRKQQASPPVDFERRGYLAPSLRQEI